MGFAIVTLLVLVACIWSAVVQSSTADVLKVTFLDVGQGDAVFIQSPSGTQVLIDGGKNRTVIRQLARVMPWFDRSIDLVIGTHPDADHIGGLPDVLSRYRASLILQSSVLDPKGVDSLAFESAVEREVVGGAERVVAERGQVVDLGGGAEIHILFPDRDVPSLETNTGSIVARLVYGDTAFLLTGDSPKEIERYLLLLDGKDLRSNVLKAGHHGSRTSSLFEFIGFVAPEHVVFSRGCDNSYGHPHEEVVAAMKKLSVEISDTCTLGTITFVSDGVNVRKR